MNDLKILIVDDDPTSLLLLQERLKAEKYDDMTIAKSGTEAVSLISDRFFDVVITDLIMPGGVDGMGVLEAAKEKNGLAEVILVTAHASVDNAVEAMKKGATDYLEKPINFDELMIRLEKIKNLKMLARDASDLREAMETTESTASQTIQNLEIMISELEDKLSGIKKALSQNNVEALERITAALEILDSS
jgi:DNA-binding NtrC family response regulator